MLPHGAFLDMKRGLIHLVKSKRQECNQNIFIYSYMALEIWLRTLLSTPLVEYWLEQEISQLVHHEGLS